MISLLFKSQWTAFTYAIDESGMHTVLPWFNILMEIADRVKAGK